MDESLSQVTEDRRRGDRRRNRSYVFHDKRTGFDRRAGGKRGPRGLMHDLLVSVRDDRRTLSVLLITVNVLNLVDLALTLNALSIGAREANPVMASLFQAGPLWAGVFKTSAVLLASLLVWEWRVYRKALVAAFLMLAVFMGVFAYHIVGLAIFE